MLEVLKDEGNLYRGKLTPLGKRVLILVLSLIILEKRITRTWEKYNKWLSWEWYRYLFKNNSGWKNILCRAKGHPCGVWYYNPIGFEPDMRCINCDEDLG